MLYQNIFSLCNSYFSTVWIFFFINAYNVFCFLLLPYCSHSAYSLCKPFIPMVIQVVQDACIELLTLYTRYYILGARISSLCKFSKAVHYCYSSAFLNLRSMCVGQRAISQPKMTRIHMALSLTNLSKGLPKCKRKSLTCLSWRRIQSSLQGSYLHRLIQEACAKSRCEYSQRSSRML